MDFHIKCLFFFLSVQILQSEINFVVDKEIKNEKLKLVA